jgi:uncharacterized protein
MDTTRFHPFSDLAAHLLSSFHFDGDGAHDLSHLERVWSNARAIHKEEGGDLEALAAAVLLHDCVHAPKDSPLRAQASQLAAEKATGILSALAWPPSRIALVADAIETHSYSRGLTPRSLEGRILQDADRLDAIGFTGIARCFYTAGLMRSALYHPADPAAHSREPDDLHFALDHFPKKLLKLTENFQTPTGRRLAHTRQITLRAFYEGMLAEVTP